MRFFIYNKSTKKIYEASVLKSILLEKKNKRLVFTNGCFDVLHKGHVFLLEAARALGDLLVVALNGDASITKLKGRLRPINVLQDRLTVLAALEAVSYVTWFDQETPLSLILELTPGILVKGGDWEKDQIVGAKEVVSWGGEVYSLSYLKGYSTTQTIERFQLQKSKKKN